MTILRRNAAFVYLSFVVSGLTNIAPQRYFDGAAVANKTTWLAATLLLGTLTSMLGVRLAQRFGFWSRPLEGGLSVVIALTVVLLAGFEVTRVWLFVALYLLARLLANYATQEFDRRAVVLAGASARVVNDRAALALRFLGMLLGPVWFGLYFGASAWMAFGVGTLAILACASVSALKHAPVGAAVSTRGSPALSWSERLLAAAAMCAYGAYYLLASNIVFILRDLHHSAGPYAFAGVLVATVYGAAVVTSIASAPKTRRGVALPWMLLAPGVMIAAGVCLDSSAAARPFVAILAAMVLGIAFAFFMLAIRNHVTRELEAGNARWLALFNDLGNTSALVGFSVMFAVVLLSRTLGVDYAKALVGGLCGLGACAFALACPAIARRPHTATAMH